MEKFKDKKIIIMGLGNYENGSGISAALFFAKQKANVLVTDLKSENDLKKQILRLEKYKNVSFVLGGHRESDFKDADYIFQNPSVPKHSKYLKIARTNNIPIINDWSIFLSSYDNFLIGITGTRGKSTTTSLLYGFIKSRDESAVIAGNIGISPLNYFGKIKKEDIVVAELSSWLLQGFESVGKSPSISIITNLMADHLNQYLSIDDYYADKKNIFKFQKSGDCLILNKDDKESRKLRGEIKRINSNIFWFSRKRLTGGKGVFADENHIIFRNNGKNENVCNLKDVRLIGRHNLENVLAAICAAKIYGIKNSTIKKVLNGFRGLPNRLELVRNNGGVAFYNDTTSTSPDGTIAALDALDKYKGKIILLAGGADKGLDYGNFTRKVKKSVKSLIVFKGVASDKILSAIGKTKFPVVMVDNMTSAVLTAKESANRGDVILLSPGAASFGTFKNEFDRGEQFCEIVKNL